MLCRRPFPTRLVVTGLALLLSSGIVACGKKKDPIPPPRLEPAPTRDLTVSQRGDEILFEFTYPTLTPTGHALPPISELEVWQADRRVPTLLFAEPALPVPPVEGDSTDTVTPDEEIAATLDESSIDPTEPVDFNEEHLGPTQRTDPDPATASSTDAPPVAAVPAPTAVTPPQSKESLIRMTARELVDEGEIVLELEEEELDAAVSGSKIHFRLPLPEPPPREPRFDEQTGEPLPPAETAWVFGLRTYTSARLRSGFSNLAVLVPEDPPPSPSNLVVAAGAGGVELRWDPVQDAEIDGYRVYRREAQVRDWGPPLRVLPPTLTEFIDSNAAYGARYIYTVTASSRSRPVIESAPAAEFEIDFADRFPPLPPRELVLLPDSGRVRVLWQASPSDDATAYRVYRRQRDTEAMPVGGKPTVRLEFEDRTVTPGATYLYRVIALDAAGNESEPSEEAAVTVPR